MMIAVMACRAVARGQRARLRREGFGAVRAIRAPLPMCRSEIESCYEHRTGELGCVNPEFKELAAGSPTFRVFARLT